MNDAIIWTPERLPLSALLPKKWKRNPRQSSKRTAENLAATKERFAQPYPILIDLNGDMVDGHQRIDAWAHKWGKDLVVDVSRANRPFSEVERQEFVLLFHQGAFGQWDYDALANFDPAQLATYGFDTDALDQTRREMAFLIEMLGEGEGEAQAGEEGDAEPQIDKAAELQAEWGTEVGQLWHIGEHRLLIGDCTVRENVARLMGGEKADMVFTDPPYGMSLNTNYQDIHKGASTGRNFDKIINDDKEFNPSCIFVLDAKEYFLWGADYYKHFLPKGGSWHIWDKTVGRFNGRIGNEFEMCWSKNSHKREIISIEWVGYNGMKEQDTIKRVHPTQKPIELCLHFIKDYSKNNVIDLFLGSGSTMVAAHNLGRKCYGMELSPAYGAVILQRMIDAFPDIDIYKAE